MAKPFLKVKQIRASAEYTGRNSSSDRRFSHEPLCAILSHPERNTEAPAYGVEIELPVTDSVSGSIWQAMNKLPVDRKRDGSLSYNDVEFVFPPMSKSQWKRSTIFDTFASIYDEHLYTERNSDLRYGTHIHTNVAGWATASALLVSYLVQTNPAFFTWLACRSPYDILWHYGSGSMTDVDGRFSGAPYRSYIGTIEYRMFDANVDKERLLAWFDILDGIEDYVRHKSVLDSVLDSALLEKCGTFNYPAQRRHRVLFTSLYNQEVLDESRFRNWMESKYCAKKHPLLHHAYLAFKTLAINEKSSQSGSMDGQLLSYGDPRSFAYQLRVFNEVASSLKRDKKAKRLDKEQANAVPS